MSDIEASDYIKVLKVLDSLSTGMTETRACDNAGISGTKFRKLRDSSSEIRALYDEAMARGTDALVDLLTDADALMEACYRDVKLAGVLSKNIAWVAERRNRKAYGAQVKVEQDVNVRLDRTILDAIEAGRKRARGELPAPGVEDAVVLPAALPKEIEDLL